MFEGRPEVPCNIESMFRETMAKNHRPPATQPMLAIDECLDHPTVGDLGLNLVTRQVVSSTTSLWDRIWQRPDGSLVSIQGGGKRFMSDGNDNGKLVKGFSANDGEVVCLLLGNLYSNDRVALITENTRWDKNGLRDLLVNHVKPAIEIYHYDRYGLHVFFKKGKTSMLDFCTHVAVALEHNGVSIGWADELV